MAETHRAIHICIRVRGFDHFFQTWISLLFFFSIDTNQTMVPPPAQTGPPDVAGSKLGQGEAAGGRCVRHCGGALGAGGAGPGGWVGVGGGGWGWVGVEGGGEGVEGGGGGELGGWVLGWGLGGKGLGGWRKDMHCAQLN